MIHPVIIPILARLMKKDDMEGGNREGADLTRFTPCHLPDEIEVRFGSDRAEETHIAMLRAFSALPLMAMIDRGVFLTYASFPREKVPWILTSVDRDDILRTIWGHPVVDDPPYEGRQMGMEFNKRELATFLKKMGCNILIRGHDPLINGIPLFHDNMLTITTSRIYRKEGTCGTFIVRIEGG